MSIATYMNCQVFFCAIVEQVQIVDFDGTNYKKMMELSIEMSKCWHLIAREIHHMVLLSFHEGDLPSQKHLFLHIDITSQLDLFRYKLLCCRLSLVWWCFFFFLLSSI